MRKDKVDISEIWLEPRASSCRLVREAIGAMLVIRVLSRKSHLRVVREERVEILEIWLELRTSSCKLGRVARGVMSVIRLS